MNDVLPTSLSAINIDLHNRLGYGCLIKRSKVEMNLAPAGYILAIHFDKLEFDGLDVINYCS